jgi:UDP-glucose 4-epimerase
MDRDASSRMDDANVLITGGLGFIGSSVAHRAVDLGANVTIYDSMMPQFGGNIANINGIEDKVVTVHGDIRDFDMLKQYVKDQDFIFHCAGQVSHMDSMSNPFFDLDINCKGTLNVLEAARMVSDTAKLIFTGTRSQIGRMKYSPVDENHPEFPIDIYSANKSVSEKYHLIYYQTYGMPAVSMRLSNVFGPRAQIKQKGYGIVNYLVRMALLKETITVYEPGTQTRDFIYIDDAVDALVLAAEKSESAGEVFFVGSGKETTFVEVVKLIIKTADSGDWKLIPWPQERRAIEVGDVVLSIDKAKRVLDWCPRTSLVEGLSKTVSFYKQRMMDYL